MATGGTFQSQNKVRPGAYINFIGTPKTLSSVGERGVVAVPMSMSWGGQIIEIIPNDLITGASLEKAGVMFTDDAALNLRLLLQSCSKAIIYRLNATTATKASKTVDGLKVTATCGGTFGNKIKFTVKVDTGQITVKTYADGMLKDTQRVATVAGLVSNAFVDFEAAEGTLASIETPTALVGGADGEEVTDISAALAAFEEYRFNILAITQTGSSTKEQAVLWVEGLRNDQGVKVQVVLPEYNGDSEAVISTWQGYKLEDGTAVSKAQAVLAVASLEAGATITQSLSGTVIPGAVEVSDAPKTNDDIVEALNAGKLILSRRSDGAVIIEKDQNTLHTFTPTKSYIFSKNRPVRVCDQIGNDVKALWNTSYLGKVSNDENGRNIFKNDLLKYFRTLEEMGAIEDFSADDVIVTKGNDADSVVVQLYVKPVDSMEKLYMTVNVVG
jgi:hypothetical protein